MVHRSRTVAVALLGAALTACGRQPAAPPADVRDSATEVAKPALPLPQPEPALDRAQLVVAAMRALTAAALGENDGEAQQALKGRTFALKMRFGCPGSVASAARSWSYDEAGKALRVKVSADLAAEGVPVGELLSGGSEGIAGFTFGNPLLLASGCPGAAFASVGEGGPTIVIAQRFTAEDSRVQRPRHAYQITKAMAADRTPVQGLDLVLSGRLAALADGRPIHCVATAGGPTCLINARIDRVAIEDPANRALLGEWSQW